MTGAVVSPIYTRGVNNNAFSPNADIVAQVTGSGQPVPGALSLTYSATQAIGPILQYSRYVEINGSNTTSATTTVTTTFVATAGANLVVNVLADSTGTVTATFSTGFKAVGTAAATASTNFPVEFVSNGVAWVEMGRPTAPIAN
jgi:hypothetical protein